MCNMLYQSKANKPDITLTGDLINSVWNTSLDLHKLPSNVADQLLKILEDQKHITLKPKQEKKGGSRYGEIQTLPSLRHYLRTLEDRVQEEKRKEETDRIARQQLQFNRVIAITGGVLALIGIWGALDGLKPQVTITDNAYAQGIIIIIYIFAFVYITRFLFISFTEE